MASVNVPVNREIKERDVNNKLQLYGIYSAFANGKVPSNKQIDIALNSFLESKALKSPSGKLSEEGRKLVADARDVVEQAKILLLSKNEGNLLQDFIWQTQHIDGANAGTPNAPISKDAAQKHGNDALEGLRTLGALIISNGQFRKLLNDASLLFRDMAGDAAQKAANKVNPSEDDLRQIDEPAADNTWHDVPDLSKGNLKQQAKSTWNEQKPFNNQDLKQAAGDASQAAHPSGSRDPADTADLAARDQQHGTDSGVKATGGAQKGMDSLQAKASANVPEETKNNAREARDRTKGYLQEKMPKERREQTIWRLKKMVVEIQGHRDYQRAIETLLSLAEQYTGHAQDVAGQSAGTVKDAHNDSNLKTAEADLKTLLERFANGTSSEDLFDSIKQIYRDADRDPELKDWFKRVNSYIRRCLQEQGYILQDQSTEEWNQIYDKGEYLLRDKYRSHTDRILDEFKFFGNQFDEDPQNTRFGDAVQRLFLNLGNDENGKATFKPHLVKDLTDVILPAVFENIRYVPVPRIEYTDPMVDAVIENLIIESDNLAPNVLEFSSDNYWRWGRKKISNNNKNKVMLAVSGVQLDLRDVAYYVRKKEGFPSIKDTGVCDIFMGGSGLSFKIAAETAGKTDRQNFFKISKVDVDIKNVKINIKKSNHKILLAVAKPILLKVLRPAMQKIIEKQIKDSATQLDGLLYQVQKEADRAKEEARRNPDPENVENIYSRYANAFKTRVTQGKRKTEDAAADKKANMAITQHDSIFPNIKLPGGISSKATEYKELAAKGDKWESPVFSIGSAKESSNIPKAPAVRRKPHSTATPGAVSGNQSGYASQPSYGTGASTLGNQMDQAFQVTPSVAAPYSNGSTANTAVAPGGTLNGGMTGSALNGDLNKSTDTRTTLGAQNPVLTGKY